MFGHYVTPVSPAAATFVLSGSSDTSACTREAMRRRPGRCFLRRPVTHKFALVRLADNFAEDDNPPILPTEPWFDNREEAIAVLPELLNQENMRARC